jgi:pimeloyl-ACP methyl ester carboxylesterase
MLVSIVQLLDAVPPVAQVKGMDLAAAINLVSEDVKAEGRLFIPGRTARLGAVITTMSWGLGDQVYADSQVRALAETTDSALLLARVSPVAAYGVNNRPVVTDSGFEALLTVLRRLAEDSGHPELASAPLAFWGHSAAGNFGAAFAMRHPERTAAVTLYQSAAALVVRTEEDVTRLARTPLLIIEGIVDPKFEAAASETLLNRGRAVGAPWAFVRQPDAPHGSESHRKLANGLLVSWIAGVLRHRIPQVGKPLVPIASATGWIGSHETGAIIEAGSASTTATRRTSWLPDKLSATEWQSLVGAER